MGEELIIECLELQNGESDSKHQAEHNMWTGLWATLRLVGQSCRTE